MNTGVFEKARFRIAGDRGLLVEYGDCIHPDVLHKVRSVALLLTQEAPAGILEILPTYRSLLIVYDPLVVTPGTLARLLEKMETRLSGIRIPDPKCSSTWWGLPRGSLFWAGFLKSSIPRGWKRPAPGYQKDPWESPTIKPASTRWPARADGGLSDGPLLSSSGQRIRIRFFTRPGTGSDSAPSRKGNTTGSGRRKVHDGRP